MLVVRAERCARQRVVVVEERLPAVLARPGPVVLPRALAERREGERRVTSGARRASTALPAIDVGPGRHRARERREADGAAPATPAPPYPAWHAERRDEGPPPARRVGSGP